MKCPYCGDRSDKVIDSRESRDSSSIRRRRECQECGRRFTTQERIEEILPMVIKKDGRREPYNRQKVVGGVQRACEKRPVAVEQVEEIADRLERHLIDLGEKEVASSVIGEQIIAALRDLDEVAYVRFASVYRSFKDVDEFMKELEEVMKERNR